MKLRCLPFLLLLSACASSNAAHRGGASGGAGEVGLASYYASSLEGRRTASGEVYRGGEATCAHRRHRFGTRLQVTALSTGRSVVCKVNDRGPFVKGRVVDLSRSLAVKLGMLEQGVLKVRVEALRD